jgi:hypothetical protein
MRGLQCEPGAAESWIGGLGTYEAWLGGLTGALVEKRRDE